MPTSPAGSNNHKKSFFFSCIVVPLNSTVFYRIPRYQKVSIVRTFIAYPRKRVRSSGEKYLVIIYSMFYKHLRITLSKETASKIIPQFIEKFKPDVYIFAYEEVGENKHVHAHLEYKDKSQVNQHYQIGLRKRIYQVSIIVRHWIRSQLIINCI